MITSVLHMHGDICDLCCKALKNAHKENLIMFSDGRGLGLYQVVANPYRKDDGDIVIAQAALCGECQNMLERVINERLQSRGDLIE